MNKKQVIIAFVGGVLVLVVGVGAGFYGGMKASSKRSAFAGISQNEGGYSRGMMNGQGPQQGRQWSNDADGQRGAGRQGGMMGNRGGLLMGEIVSKDDKSFNVKMADGSSKIIFYADATTVGKSTPATASDLSVGQQVRINGQDNADGSVLAQNIQITQGQ